MPKLSALFIDAPGVKPDARGRLSQHPRTLQSHPADKDLADKIRAKLKKRARLQSQEMEMYWKPLEQRLSIEKGLQVEEASLRLVYHNVESLKAHRADRTSWATS